MPCFEMKMEIEGHEILREWNRTNGTMTANALDSSNGSDPVTK
jgi:hypothetical protein